MCVSINGPCPFDLETGTLVASKVGNLPSKFGHARLLGSRIIRYVHDGRMDRQMDRRTDGQKQYLLPLPYGRGHNKLTAESWIAKYIKLKESTIK